MPELTNFPGATAYDAKGVPTIPATFQVDPAPQFRAAWLHIAKMGNRVSGTTSERSAAAAWAWEGLEFYDTTEKRGYVRIGSTWAALSGGNAVAAYAPTAGTAVDPQQILTRTGLASGTTSPTGVLAHTLPTPFPTACIAVVFMPNQNKVAPVLVEGDVTRSSFNAFYSGAANAARSIQYIAWGY